MKVLVIGGATIDVITSIDTSDIECITLKNATNSYLMMEQGKKVEATRIETQVGGGACNAAVAMSRLGGVVGCVLKLGNDVDADRVLGRLAEEKIDTSLVRKEPTEQTGKSIIVSSHDRNAGIFVHRGSNTTLSLGDITPEIFVGIDLVYVSTLSGQSATVFPKIVKLAKEAGAFVACNPGIRQIRRRKEQVLDAFQHVDLLAINKEEATALAEGYVDISSIEENAENYPELIRDGLGEKGARVELAALAHKIHKIGCSYLVVTNGAEGAYLSTPETILFRPSIPCEVESTIGAGDAFNATIAYALRTKKTVYSALNMAAVNGASVAASLDTQSGLMTADDLQKKVLGMDSARVLSFPKEIKEEI
ncbi:carbohydrate kinase family protein [Terasakiella sp. A23]|uniref:carbohydrate kinase family protein n=1 Tax=Terasakiella sp. FCG-A23 TaxID=3080561 RepID=UPI002953C152|nr:carbohydrate kinase family protein [Terasakiella sp. A23]MDV7341087.1 carbohydrate kinase family protein [Terasakiella sp. A23]